MCFFQPLYLHIIYIYIYILLFIYFNIYKCNYVCISNYYISFLLIQWNILLLISIIDYFVYMYIYDYSI